MDFTTNKYKDPDSQENYHAITLRAIHDQLLSATHSTILELFVNTLSVIRDSFALMRNGDVGKGKGKAQDVAMTGPASRIINKRGKDVGGYMEDLLVADISNNEAVDLGVIMLVELAEMGWNIIQGYSNLVRDSDGQPSNKSHNLTCMAVLNHFGDVCSHHMSVIQKCFMIMLDTIRHSEASREETVKQA
ncbi:hypothetical protein PILCRDRAFT_2592 [Piloderma croceum F 1598]|uniref:Uncharacterized protein n=1 Tax=Piloderma croceum (strain F 1598) TaxID=765440 RepID=A0A0C3GFD6_PILCF|nr:hypothetical protein PILCRDRAFT_2592 [Piloderma croceum F 1598]